MLNIYYNAVLARTNDVPTTYDDVLKMYKERTKDVQRTPEGGTLYVLTASTERPRDICRHPTDVELLCGLG